MSASFFGTGFFAAMDFSPYKNIGMKRPLSSFSRMMSPASARQYDRRRYFPFFDFQGIFKCGNGGDQQYHLFQVLEKPGITHDQARVKNRLEGKDHVLRPQGRGYGTFH